MSGPAIVSLTRRISAPYLHANLLKDRSQCRDLIVPELRSEQQVYCECGTRYLNHRAEKSNQNNWYICCILLKMCRPAKMVCGGIKKSGYDRETAHELVNRKIVHARLLRR